MRHFIVLTLAFIWLSNSRELRAEKLIVDVTKIKFIGPDGRPEKGLIVVRHYANCSTNREGTDESKLTDNNGEVDFPRHTIEVSWWKDTFYWGGFHGCTNTSNDFVAYRKEDSIWWFAPKYEDRTKPFNILVNFQTGKTSHGRIDHDG